MDFIHAIAPASVRVEPEKNAPRQATGRIL